MKTVNVEDDTWKSLTFLKVESNASSMDDLLKSLITLEHNLKMIYDFIEQGTTQATDDMSKATFKVIKHRLDILFPQKVKN